MPLLFWRSEGVAAGRRIADPVELVDVYPTLLELLVPEVEMPVLEGESLVRWLGSEVEEAAEPVALAFSEAGGGSPLTHFRSVQDGRWKLIYHPSLKNRQGEPLPPSWELYHLDQDPGETEDLADAEPEERRRLGRELSTWMKGSDWIRRPTEEIEAQSEETLKALRALGYVE